MSGCTSKARKNGKCAISIATAFLLAAGIDAPSGWAQTAEKDFYRIVPLPIPDGVVLEVGGLTLTSSGQLALCTRRGDIYLVDNPLGEPSTMRFRLFASGLHEPLGIAERDGWLYVTQRGEVSRLKDADADGKADVFETVADGWGLSGDYHEYAFGSAFDRQGNLWVVLCLTGSFSSEALYRGWCVRVTPRGEVIPTCSGLRSPGGIGMNADGDVFYTDNQGPWNGTCSLKHLVPGSFQGHPAGNRWYTAAAEVMGPRPIEPQSGSRMMVEAKRIAQLVPPAVYFPYQRMGQSASGIVCDTTENRFGPFRHQLFVADQAHSTLMRVYLEKVQGRYQGACFPFRQGFASGSLALCLAPEGKLFVGGTSRGWGARGPKPFSLERLEWTGKVPFELRTMELRRDGFALTFTLPVDRTTAENLSSYRMATHTYIYQSNYGSPEVDRTEPKILAARLSQDAMRVYLYVDGLQEGHVHELFLPGIRSADGAPLLHAEAYYTLNYFSDRPLNGQP